jgi:3-phenylpropionate/trans-cinnamate dioxygenase ferredoxin reductase subunit
MWLHARTGADPHLPGPALRRIGGVSLDSVVIAGASLAGANAAATLRSEGFGGSIVMLGAETRPPYERPPLSKEYLQGRQPFEKALVKPPEFYDEQKIDLRLGEAAVSLDPAARVVLTAAGEHRYDALLIATGARNRRLDVSGADLTGILDLRTVEDSDAIKAAASGGGRAVVVGLGFIGAEVAASLRGLGIDVTAIEPFPAPLYRVLGPEVSAVLAEIHRDNGVTLILEDSVASFEGDRRVERVVTKAGRRVECDFAVVGVGVEPETSWLDGSGVAMDNGVVVDELCRTNLEGVFAAGDLTNHYHPVFERHIRVEHWQNAIKQGEAAARNMLGRNEPYKEIHWFWSDQYDAAIQYAGYHTSWDALVVRGGLSERKFAAFYLEGGRMLAAVSVNWPRDVRRAAPLIASKAQVDPEALRDPGVDLRKLIPGG